VTTPYIQIHGSDSAPALLIADHASNHVPPEVSLGINDRLLSEHIALDIGVAELGAMLCVALPCPGLLGGISRLVIDLNREEDAPHIIPVESDGHPIPGNRIDTLERARRIAQYWRPYHDRIAAQITAQKPRLLISLHSFTPRLSSKPDQARPWQVGILYNQDDRAARMAIPLLEKAGVVVGDQLPYSGKLLNATMNVHGEANGIPYLGIEMRQDLIGDSAGQAYWAGVLLPVLRAVLAEIAA
jgi:predicted N-formylglutamate amidohydrolase